MVCPVDADGGAARMSETGRPSRSLPPSGAPAAAASASGAGSRERDEAGVLPIRDARSARVPETAIINHPILEVNLKNMGLRITPHPGTIRTPDTSLGPRTPPGILSARAPPCTRNVDTESSFPAPGPGAVRWRVVPREAVRARAPAVARSVRYEPPRSSGSVRPVGWRSRFAHGFPERNAPFRALILCIPRTGNGRGD